jgi:hypothetical protein
MGITTLPGMAIVIEGKDAIMLYRLMALEKMLGLELKGLRHSRFLVYTSVKKEFKLKGNKQSVFEQFQKIVQQAKESYDNEKQRKRESDGRDGQDKGAAQDP